MPSEQMNGWSCVEGNQNYKRITQLTKSTFLQFSSEVAAPWMSWKNEEERTSTVTLACLEKRWYAWC